MGSRESHGLQSWETKGLEASSWVQQGWQGKVIYANSLWLNLWCLIFSFHRLGWCQVSLGTGSGLWAQFGMQCWPSQGWIQVHGARVQSSHGGPEPI